MIAYLSIVVDVSFLIDGGLSRVVDTVDPCGDDSWRSFPLFDNFIVRPLVELDDSFDSLLFCVVDVT